MLDLRPYLLADAGLDGRTTCRIEVVVSGLTYDRMRDLERDLRSAQHDLDDARRDFATADQRATAWERTFTDARDVFVKDAKVFADTADWVTRMRGFTLWQRLRWLVMGR